MIIILSAPSGCGKSSVAQRLLELDKDLVLSISATTRMPRPSEIDGKHYFFVSKEEFKQLSLLEQAEIYGNNYGTPAPYVYSELQKGKDILFDIDFHGAYQIKKNTQIKVISIFILPPSIEELEKRLVNRKQDADSEIKKRLAEAENEMQHAKNYDYRVVNDNFEQTIIEIKNIIELERKRIAK